MRINQSRLQQAAQLQQFFVEKYPNAFFLESKPKKPLALNTYDKLCELTDKHAHLSKKGIKRFLGLYCSTAQYIEALKQPNAMRIDLDGNETEPVSVEHQTMAANTPRSQQIKFSETKNHCPGKKAKRQHLAEAKKAKLKTEQKAKKKEAKEAAKKKKAAQLAKMSLQEKLIKRYQGEQAIKLNQLIQMMKQEFPKAFNAKTLLVPIAGVESQKIIAKAEKLTPDISDALIKKFWAVYLNSDEYMNAMVTASHLIDLEGNPCREISEGARENTREKIAKSKKPAKRKKPGKSKTSKPEKVMPIIKTKRVRIKQTEGS